MLMEQIFNNIIELINILQKKEVVIFGTGKGGTVIGIVLEMIKIKNFYYVDNNTKKWGFNLLDKPIYSPEVILKSDKEDVIVLVASSYYDEISSQLDKYGLLENIHFYNVLDEVRNVLDNDSTLHKIIKINIEKQKTNILIFGDSVMSCISKNDDKKITLYDMIKQKAIPLFNIQEIHRGAFHLGIFYISLHALINLKKIPDVIILPINMRSFSPSWDLNPIYQWADDIKEIKGFLNSRNYIVEDLLHCDRSTEFENFVNYTTTYGSQVEEMNSKFICWENYKPTNNKEIHKKYNNLYKWHYMYTLSEDNRKYKMLNNIVELAGIHKIKLITYITPINYKQAEKYIGKEFLLAYKKNLNLIEDFFIRNRNTEISFDDYSFLFSQSYFTHENDTTEHLNQQGREILSEIISDKIEKMLNIF